jgi:hypothetical protein
MSAGLPGSRAKKLNILQLKIAAHDRMFNRPYAAMMSASAGFQRYPGLYNKSSKSINKDDG